MEQFDFSQIMAREWFHFDPDTGIMTWKVQRTGPQWIGKEAGTYNSRGYKTVMINGKQQKVHNLIVLWMTGKWLPGTGLEVDHFDRTPDNNQWSNLRIVSSARGSWNRGTPSNNSTGVKGVTEYPYRIKRYRASIMRGGKRKILGYFKTLEEAEEAYKKAALARERNTDQE